MKKLRLDKVLADCGFGSRKEVKALVKAGAVALDGDAVWEPGLWVSPEQQQISVCGEPLYYQEFYYIMMNKPPGVISATKDPNMETVLDLLPPSLKNRSLFPVGRLDKDTEGLLLISNDGPLAHRLLSPKRHVPKTYWAQIKGEVTQADAALFKQGIPLDPDFTTLPARLKILSAGSTSYIEVTLYEGKYHQVKRMFEAAGKRVEALKRLSMGPLMLDPALAPGTYRMLTEAELHALKTYEPEKGREDGTLLYAKTGNAPRCRAD